MTQQERHEKGLEFHFNINEKTQEQVLSKILHQKASQRILSIPHDCWLRHQLYQGLESKPTLRSEIAKKSGFSVSNLSDPPTICIFLWVGNSSLVLTIKSSRTFPALSYSICLLHIPPGFCLWTCSVQIFTFENRTF